VGPTISKKDIERLGENMQFNPQMDDLANLLSLTASSTRLKIFYLLAELKELCVCDIAEILDVSVPAISQHLSKFKAYGLVKYRRNNQTLYYSLMDTAFSKTIKTLLSQSLTEEKA